MLWKIIEPLRGLHSTEADRKALESCVGSAVPFGGFMLILLQMVYCFGLPPTSSWLLFFSAFARLKIS